MQGESNNLRAGMGFFFEKIWGGPNLTYMNGQGYKGNKV